MFPLLNTMLPLQNMAHAHGAPLSTRRHPLHIHLHTHERAVLSEPARLADIPPESSIPPAAENTHAAREDSTICTARSNAVVKKYNMHYHIDKRSFPGGSIGYSGRACGFLGTHMGQCTDDCEEVQAMKKEDGQWLKSACAPRFNALNSSS